MLNILLNNITYDNIPLKSSFPGFPQTKDRQKIYITFNTRKPCIEVFWKKNEHGFSLIANGDQ